MLHYSFSFVFIEQYVEAIVQPGVGNFLQWVCQSSIVVCVMGTTGQCSVLDVCH